MFQFSTFLSFVGQKNVGFTAWKVFVITKQTFQMVGVICKVHCHY